MIRAGSLTYLSENSISIISEYDTTHRVEEHLKHGLGSERGPYDITDSLCSSNVSLLGYFALLTLRVSIENHNRRLIVHFQFFVFSNYR